MHIGQCSRLAAVSLVLLLDPALATEDAANDLAPKEAPSVRAAYALLERLPRLPGQFMVLQSSSHNKTGHNGDENWPLYKDEHGDDVIFDAAGPGCMRSMWATHIAEDAALKFYFDGEATPRYRIPEIGFFEGKHSDFPSPLVSYEHRGRYALGYAGNCFIPIPFRESLKISITGESRFFHVLYELYPFGTAIETFTGREDRTSLLESFEHLGADPVPDEQLEIVEVASDENPPGGEVTLLARKETAGIIRRIVLDVDGSLESLRESEIRMRWDGHVRDDVRAPTGIFFGCANQARNVASLPLSVETLPDGRVRLSCYWPMPFWQEARLAWYNGSRHTLGALSARVAVAPNRIDRIHGAYFTTLYRSGQTTYGRDWLLYESPGAGWFVGAVQSMQNGHYCEGDEHFYIDGAVSPQINGTGSEDYYLGCFWPNLEYNSPFACCVGDIQAEGGGHFRGAYRVPSCYIRFHLEAPIPFFRCIEARIQHGGLSYLSSDYRSLAFCYLNKRLALRQTDFIDVGNRASEAAHDYTASHSELTERVVASPEGEQFDTLIDEVGRQHAAGEISFTVAIDPKNQGVRLRRRLDQKSPRQTAKAYVDGRYAGRWQHGLVNEHLRWADSDFDIQATHTRGKDAIEVKLVVDTTSGRGAFTDFNYRVYCFSDQPDSDASSDGPDRPEQAGQTRPLAPAGQP